MRFVVFTLLLSMLWSANCFGAVSNRDSTEGFVFLPAGLHFAPLKANPQEARIGVFKYFGTANLKVDIGNMIDLFGWNFTGRQTNITAGIDFMAYAFVTGSQGLRLQVDALDGFFGGNLTVSSKLEDSKLYARLRVLHLSAHLVDGHYELGAKRWIDNREPIPFTKDFGELTFAHLLSPSFGIVRYYGGVSYATLVRPANIERFGFLAGVECYHTTLLGRLFDHPAIPFFAFHSSLTGTPRHIGTTNLLIGLKFGEWDSKGVVFYLSHIRGGNPFSEYFDERVTIWGAGFTADFP